MVFDLTGNHSRRDVTIDTDSSVVQDEDMTWVPGRSLPNSAQMEQWTDVGGAVARWGNRHIAGGQPTSLFQLDLRIGRYTLTSTANGQVSHGTCGGPGPTS